MTNPKVTVLMSVYNGEKYLHEAIDSILNQTFKDFEFLIINDSSIDSSRDIVLSYNDPRIRLIDNEKNIGLTRSLNKGLRLATGECVARMDADDVSEFKRLEMQVWFLDAHPSIGVVGINSYVISERGKVLGKMERPASHRKIMAKILSENQMVHSSLMWRKNLLKTYGYYNEELTFAQDYELLLRLSSVADLANLPDQLHRWRRNISTGISMTKRQAQIVVRDSIRRDFLEKHYTLNKSYADLVLTNFLNNPADIILSEYLNKILKEASCMLRLFIKLRKFLYLLTKSNFYLKKLLRAIKKKMMEIIKDQYTVSGKIIAKHGFRNHPSSLIFLMKNTCNAKCIMCGLSYANSKNIFEIALENYKRMLNNLVMDKVTEITFSGGGDPLLCKDLIKIMGYTKEIYPKVKLYLYTNGIALSEKFAQEFIKHNFCKIIISINASTAETYHKVTGVNSFNRVVSNITKLVVLRNKSPANTRIQLSFVASLLNIHDLSGLITLGSDLGIDEISMEYCRFYSQKISLNSDDFDDIIDKKYSLFFHRDHSDEIVKEAGRLARLKKIDFCYESLFSDPEQPKQRCVWPWTTILIGPQGEIYPCGGGEVMFYKSVRDCKLYFGNVLREHISKFWNNKDYRRLRHSCNYRNKNKSIPQCWNCNHTLDWEGVNSERSHFINIDT